MVITWSKPTHSLFARSQLSNSAIAAGRREISMRSCSFIEHDWIYDHDDVVLGDWVSFIAFFLHYDFGHFGGTTADK